MSALTSVDQEPVTYLQRLIIKEDDRIFFVRCSDVQWFEAIGKFAKIHIGKDAHLLRVGLKYLEQHLDPRRFVRIHKSVIVNIDSVDQLRQWFHGDYHVLLGDGTQLMLSRRYKERLNQCLGWSLNL